MLGRSGGKVRTEEFILLTTTSPPPFSPALLLFFAKYLGLLSHPLIVVQEQSDFQQFIYGEGMYDAIQGLSPEPRMHEDFLFPYWQGYARGYVLAHSDGMSKREMSLLEDIILYAIGDALLRKPPRSQNQHYLAAYMLAMVDEEGD